MGDWAPHIVGWAIVAVAVVVLALFPHSWPAVELRRSYGVRGTGPDGSLRRRDYFRGAGICFGLAIALVLGGFGFAVLAQRFPDMSRANWAASAYMFGAVLLSGVAVLSGLIMLWNGLRWRPPSDALTGTDETAV